MFQECLFIIRISQRALIFLAYVWVTLGLGGCSSTNWEFIAHMNQPRSGHTATRLNDGRGTVVGGFNANGVLNTAEIFDPTAKTWTMVGSMREPRLGTPRHSCRTEPCSWPEGRRAWIIRLR